MTSNSNQSTPMAQHPAPPDARPLWRDARLRKHADYQRVYVGARKQFSANMSWFLKVRDDDGPQRVGLTVGKVLGKAHERNRIKRRLRAIVHQHLMELPAGVDLVLHPRRQTLGMEALKLSAEVLRIFRQAATVAGQRRAGPSEQADISAQAGQASTANQENRQSQEIRPA